MPCTRSKSSSSSTQYRVAPSVASGSYHLGSPSPHPSTSVSQGDEVHCPFKGYDGCQDGVSGRGYAKSAIYRHITDKHFPTKKDKDICRDRIQTNFDCFVAWERVLQDLKMWMCFKCLHFMHGKSHALLNHIQQTSLQVH
ncbi:hypothetical protein C5167_003053 [Papaver somniferum]|uniref:Uncharacterized protein n=1 Tax=Papaver somniferum TaxID=3469 RepID=A0A4Y7L2G2_PAPSO|nr:hypothetical protein C5167_003053 [Papaver somniferum]